MHASDQVTDSESFIGLTELVDELARDHEMAVGMDGAAAGGLPAGGSGPSRDQNVGERYATAFWRICQEKGFTALCDALTFSGLRDELPRLCQPGITVLAPTNEAFALMADSVRSSQRLMRQLLLGHICSGASTLEDMNNKNCAVAVAGQTHAVYLEEGYTYVGTGRIGRADLAFEGGVLHEVKTCLMVLTLVRDSHSEQVW